MNEIIRAVLRHERTLTKWSVQLTKEFAKQKKINKRFGRAIAALGAALVFEDYNLYQTDKKVKDLENKLADLEAAANTKEVNKEE